MYTAFFGLREKPFALSPDPRFLYLSESHREALAHLLYGIEQGEGFIAITGEVGTGKTTLCRTLLRRLGSDVELAFIFNPRLSAHELLEAVLTELGIQPSGSSARALVDDLNQFLLRKRGEGRRVLLVIDEAQGLSPETLEQIRLLSNLETESAKLIQILLLGQPELDAMLESRSLRQLRQRIGVRWRLGPLSPTETGGYVRHRLQVAAGAERDIFNDAALREIHRRSGGVPRLVNLIADRALLAAYGAGEHRVGRGLARQAAAELRGRDGGRRRRPLWHAAIPLAAGLAAAAAGFAWQRGWIDGLREIELSRTAARVAPAPVVQAGLSAPAPAAGLASPAAVAAVDSAPPAAPPAPAADVGPARVDDLGLALARRAPGESAAEALSAVLAAWSLQSGAVTAEHASLDRVMQEIEAQGLGVFPLETADVDLVRSLGHPALLRIDAADGVGRLVALRRLEPDGAELYGVIPSRSALVPIEELQRSWTGEAYLVWREFEPLPALLRLGDGGDGVAWLQGALGELGFFPGSPSGHFDLATDLAVRAFQADRHLEPDGAVGPLTKMSLYRALARYEIPSLGAPGGMG
jgi:general secretion pathway protein A